MRLRNIPEAKGIVEASPFVIRDPEGRKGTWKRPGRPLVLEIGMGKGRFIIEQALLHPDWDFLGIERYESVLFRACEKMEGIPYETPAMRLERLKREEKERVRSGREMSGGAEADTLDREDFVPPENLHFLHMDAGKLPEVFAEGEVDRIYLNFSDPWPKARHARRRLTSREFLALYAQVLADGGVIEFKTDNVPLFEFSLEEIRETEPFSLESFTFDLHHDPVLCEGNVMTEYEKKFSNLGNRICKLTAVFHKTVHH